MCEIKVSKLLPVFLFVKHLVGLILHVLMAPGTTVIWILNKCNFLSRLTKGCSEIETQNSPNCVSSVLHKLIIVYLTVQKMGFSCTAEMAFPSIVLRVISTVYLHSAVQISSNEALYRGTDLRQLCCCLQKGWELCFDPTYF